MSKKDDELFDRLHRWGAWLVAVMLFVLLAMLLASANRAEAAVKSCPRDVVATPEPGLPDGAILYQVVKVYCYQGRVYTLGMDQMSPPVPIPRAQSCDMNKPFVLRGSGEKI